VPLNVVKQSVAVFVFVELYNCLRLLCKLSVGNVVMLTVFTTIFFALVTEQHASFNALCYAA